MKGRAQCVVARVLIALAWLFGVGVVVAVAGYVTVLPQLGQPVVSQPLGPIVGNADRGQYLVAAGGCVVCHTDVRNNGKLLAGGAALKTPFGTFYAPNITSDKTHGIGSWSLQQFTTAMRAGIRPDGQHYFPSFPYTSYTAMALQDLADIKRYLGSVAAVPAPSRGHDLNWPFSDRQLVGLWKEFYFKQYQLRDKPGKSAAWNRGAYLVTALGHCGECHTQRDSLGGHTGVPLAGNSNGPDGGKVPSIRALPRRDQAWTRDQLLLSLQVGMTPTGDFLGGSMAEVVTHSTAKLTADDQEAIVTHLFDLD